MTIGQSRRFSPRLEYVTVYKYNPNHIVFPELAEDRDSIARMQLAMRSLGKSLSSMFAGDAGKTKKISSPIDFLRTTPVVIDGRPWDIASVNDGGYLTTGLNLERLSSALSQYEELPEQSVFLITNSHADHRTGSSSRSRWVPQAEALLISPSSNAKKVANALLIEAARQSGQELAMNAWSRSALPTTGYAGEDHKINSSLLSGRDYRVEIKTTSGKEYKLWASELEGFSSDAVQRAGGFETWVTRVWHAPENTLQWRVISSPDSSRRKTSGWVVYADAAGEPYEMQSDIAQYRAGLGHSFTDAGALRVFSVDPENDISANTAIVAIRKSENGQLTVVDLCQRDVVLSRNKSYPLFMGKENMLYRTEAVFTSRPKYDRKKVVRGTVQALIARG